MNHYEVLGVRPDARKDEIRRAYLVLARQYHPDFHTAAGERSVRDAEARMREINAAWEVLGEPATKAAFDRTLPARIDHASTPSHTQSQTQTPQAPPMSEPSTEFRPYFTEDADDDDSWRYEPDEGDPASVPPRSLLMAPPALLALGVVLVVISLPVGSDLITAVGIICIVLGALFFVGAPVVAMFKSQSAEEGARRRR